MSDDALLSTPSPRREGQGSGWQEGRMDEGRGRGPEGRLQQGGWEAPWLSTGGHPSGANPFSPPLPEATGHYGPGYGDPTRHFSMDPELRSGEGARGPGASPSPQAAHDEHHHHYQRFRDDHGRQLDEAYQSWRRDNQHRSFDDWREHHRSQGGGSGASGRSEGALQGWGRAVTEVVTGPREPNHDHGAGVNERDRAFDGGTEREQRAQTERFFERS